MREYLEPMLGTTGALIAQFAVTLLIILVLVLVVFWLIRRFSGGRFGTNGSRARQPRLSVLDALPIDQRRRLVLVRRDNVEHLLLIGGPSDVVVEATIQRPPPGQRRIDPQARFAPPAAPAKAAAPPIAEPPRPAPQPDAGQADSRQTEVRQTPIRQTDARRAEPQQDEPLPEPEPMGAQAPEPEIAQEPAPPAPAEPAAEPAGRATRGMPAFLTSGRSRQTPAADSAAARRESRNRVLEQARPLQRTTPSPFPARDQAPTEPEPPVAARSGSFRPTVPPAPPVEPSSFSDEIFGQQASGQGKRFEPSFGVDEDNEAMPSASERSRAPEVAPPTEDDQPVGIDVAFDENAPVLSRDERIEPASAQMDADDAQGRPSQVGDLEKEMARLLGEISGSKR